MLRENATEDYYDGAHEGVLLLANRAGYHEDSVAVVLAEIARASKRALDRPPAPVATDPPHPIK